MYLKAQRTRGSVPGHHGFTIIEMVVATFLTALLALLLAAAVATFARPAAEVDGRTRLALEASLAAEALARDLGGYLIDASGASSTLQQYQFSNWSFSSDGAILFLNYQGITPGPPYQIVTYQQQDVRLVRTQLSDGLQTVVAQHVTGFAVQPGPDDPSQAQITLTLTYPDPSSPRKTNPSFSGTYVFIGVPPPP
jgi:type II secretory pathway pseudopilin PulG